MNQLSFLLILLSFGISILHFGDAQISRNNGQGVSKSEREELKSILRQLSEKTKKQISSIQSKDSVKDIDLKQLFDKFLERRRQHVNENEENRRTEVVDTKAVDIGPSLPQRQHVNENEENRRTEVNSGSSVRQRQYVIEKEENRRTEVARGSSMLGNSLSKSENGSYLDQEDLSKSKEEEAKPYKENIGADKMDVKNIDPESALAKIVAGMAVERNGEENSPNGLNLKDSKNTVGHNLETLDLTDTQLIEMGLKSDKPGRKTKRNFALGGALWPKGIIPFDVDTPLDTTERRDVINRAVEQFNNLTCIRFKPRSEALAAEIGHENFLRFYNGSGCRSSVGYRSAKPQWISLGIPGCLSVGIAIHEMCHAIGMQHEQSRSDRDKYVRIIWDNIKNGKENYNFGKSSTLDLNHYDYESIMHYGLWDFSKNGGQSIEIKDPNLKFLVNSASGLMFYDIEDITKRYGCADRCVNPLKCEHGGFLNFECKCHCPVGIKGERCEEVETDNGCGGIVDVNLAEEKFITSPNYPSNYDVGAICRWLIRVPAGWFVRMTVEQLHLADDGTTLNRCYHWLGIRYNLLAQTAIKRCGDMVGHTYTTTRDGNPNMMLLTFNSRMVQDIAPRKGFKLRVEAVGRGCLNDPCVHGVCKESELDCQYICLCDPGFNGTNCDTLVEDATIECTFDYHTKCFLKNSKTDDFQWAINSGPTSSQGTGPHRAYRGSNYIYAEMSSPRQEGEKAVLESSVNLPSRDRCLTFIYNMYGKNVGSLNVYTEDGSSKNNVWSRTGNQGNKWIKASVNITAMDNLKISFEAVRGADWNGDIALDDIQLISGLCPAGPIECLMSAKGVEYEGHLNITKSGLPCQRWDSQTPNSHNYGKWSDEENYCRNSDGGEDAPWCYTSNENTRWQFCELPYCFYDECIRSKAGYEYEGKTARTSSGLTCQRWDSQSPHTHQITSLNGQDNYCRNTDKEPQPWCYTTDLDKRFEYCSIPRCETLPDECLRTARGKEYFGTVSVTSSGKTCQRWDSQKPHTHQYTFIADQGNFCRNPDNEPSPWCYTTDNNTRYELCDIPYCEKLHCYSNPCKNGGTCLEEGSTYRCNCSDGYSGGNCETEVETNCFRSVRGWDYEGSTNFTQSGLTCQRWDSNTPYSHTYHQLDDQENYCRNPSPKEDLLPWCYTTDSNKRWEYCNISKCESPISSCFSSKKGEDYFGTVSTTKYGETCQRWDSQKPHTHSYGYLFDQQNYCRNPFGEEKGPWCYTTDSDTRWNYCVARACSAGNH